MNYKSASPLQWEATAAATQQCPSNPHPGRKIEDELFTCPHGLCYYTMLLNYTEPPPLAQPPRKVKKTARAECLTQSESRYYGRDCVCVLELRPGSDKARFTIYHLRAKKTEQTDFFQKNKESMKVLSAFLFDR